MLKCSMPYNHRTITIRMPIPEKVLKPDSVIEEESRKWKQDNSQFRPVWLRSLDRFNIPYRALGYSLIVHILAIVGLLALLS